MTTMRIGSETLIFWGAGATASLGLRTTAKQAETIKYLVNEQPLSERVKKALPTATAWHTVFSDLLLILGDQDKNIYCISNEERKTMGRHWQDQSHEKLDARIQELRALFDWSALKEVVRICPGFNTDDRLQIQDICNVLDLHIHSLHGFPILNDKFLPSSRLIAARRALQMLLNTLFYIDWQIALSNKQELVKHLDFARLLTEHHQQEGLKKAATRQYFDSREFYLGDIAFTSLNYDPVALWAQFIANRDANKDPPYIGEPRVPLKVFHDFGIFMAVSTIDKPDNDPERKERVWYPLNEASAQRMNDRDHNSRRVRINKFLFPHGCLCWRECPSCGKLSAYMGKDWDFFSPALIPPPPLKGFVTLAKTEQLPETGRENEAWESGKVDARACVHCQELTFAQDTQTIMQSNFKTPPPPFINEVQRDLRVATQAANHIIFMGYSLPPDDVSYRAFFAARRQRHEHLRCSVVVGKDWGNRWHSPEEIDRLLLDMPDNEAPRTTLEATRDIFGKENVRFFGGGIPPVFCDGNRVSLHRFQQLINWTEKE